MNERRNTDELLKEMNETHRNHATKLNEDSLLMHALATSPKRSRWAALGWVVAALVVIGIVLKPMLPAMGGKPCVEHMLGGVRVRAFHSSDEYWPGTFYRCTWEGKELFIAQQTESYPDEPLVATVGVDKRGYLLFPADVALAEPNLFEAAKCRPHLDIVQSVAAQMNKAKLWPADLWSIKSFINKLNRGEYRMVYSGPMNAGFVFAANRYYGNQAGYWLQGFGMSASGGDSLEAVGIRLYVWPDSFTLRAFTKPNKSDLYLSGDEHGYDVYQIPEWWGEGVREDLLRVKHYLPEYLELLPLLGDNISPELAQSLRHTVEQIVDGEPRALYRADGYELNHRMEPWQPAKPDQAERERQKQALAGLVPEFSFEWRGLKVSSRSDREELTIERDGLELSLCSPKRHYAEGFIDRNGERLRTRVFMLNEGRLPYLRCRLSPENERLLDELAAMAEDALKIPAKEWPSESFPHTIVENWLDALVDRQFAARESLGHTMLMALIEREGGSATLIVNLGERASMGKRTSMDLNLRLQADGFQLLNTATGYLVSMSGGKLSAVRAADAGPEALTAENERQLKTALGVIGASPEGIPSAVQPGIEQFREFLEHGEAVRAAAADELPYVPWAGMVVLDRYSQIAIGMESLKDTA
jgi:hypothetical protein